MIGERAETSGERPTLSTWENATTSPITPAQERMLRVYARGYSISETAARLGLAEQTVKNHLSKMYGQLHATNVREALVTLGWLRVP